MKSPYKRKSVKRKSVKRKSRVKQVKRRSMNRKYKGGENKNTYLKSNLPKNKKELLEYLFSGNKEVVNMIVLVITQYKTSREVFDYIENKIKTQSVQQKNILMLLESIVKYNPRIFLDVNNFFQTSTYKYLLNDANILKLFEKEKSNYEESKAQLSVKNYKVEEISFEYILSRYRNPKDFVKTLNNINSWLLTLTSNSDLEADKKGVLNIMFFNKMIRHMTESILIYLKQEKYFKKSFDKEFEKVISWLDKAMFEAIKTKNIQTATIIHGILSFGPIKFLDPKIRDLIYNKYYVVSADKQYKLLREYMIKNEDAFPFLGLYTTELEFKKFDDFGERIIKMSERLKNFREKQKKLSKYNLSENDYSFYKNVMNQKLKYNPDKLLDSNLLYEIAREITDVKKDFETDIDLLLETISD